MTAAVPLAVTMGEPAGVGGELSLKAWLARRSGSRSFFVLDDPDRLAALARRLGVDVPLREIERPEEAVSLFSSALPVLPVRLAVAPVPGRPDVANAPDNVSPLTRPEPPT